jgi:SpoVK/Ycf46/Vps4 family AAA+-type ATPase
MDHISLNKNAIASVTLSMMSNTISAAAINEYVRKIHSNYIEELKNSLGNQIYFFDQKNRDTGPPPPPMCSPNSDEMMNYKRMLIMTSPKQLSFNMMPFYSNKAFSNIYGSEIRKIEQRIRFFMDNKQWYDSKGIPYQLGIMLSGVPGSGKTSCIRAISKLTNRHIVNVNFANITTASQLKNLFYSDKIQVYTDNTMSNMATYFIPIEQRVYVLEEIDAIGDIVKQRTHAKKTHAHMPMNDELTLMEILTILDGTMETPGRIIIMTSNHPEQLDKALIRPGRIDVHAHLGYADREQIKEMYEGYMDTAFPMELFDKLPDGKITPAEVGQVLFRYFDRNLKGDLDPLEVIAALNDREHNTSSSSILG